MASCYESIVVLTGSGISQESGIQTFRGQGGLWEGHRVEEVASPEAFERNPELVLEFYNQRRRQLLSGDVRPNAAHKALADFESAFHGSFFLVTQNVDDLHERAGSQKVVHMHGSLLEARCMDTGEVFPWKEALTLRTAHPRYPDRKGRLRPNIVWFGEMPMAMETIGEALSECDLFVAIGTSGLVYPAAGFVQMVPVNCRTVELNLERSTTASLFEECFQGPATKVVPEFFSSLEAELK